VDTNQSYRIVSQKKHAFSVLTLRCSSGTDRLAASANAVVVTLNYRLGPLGFLVTEEDTSIGNGGMHGIAVSGGECGGGGGSGGGGSGGGGGGGGGG
jgi:hypothetical protein